MHRESTIDCRAALTPDGWTGPLRIGVDPAGHISSLHPISAAEAGSSGFIVPGMPNLHSHAFQRQMAGLTEFAVGDDSFWTWRESMYRVASRITPEQLQAIAAWLQVEMLEAGFTSCAEFHYLHHGPAGEPYADIAEMSLRLLAAAGDSGMALTLLPVLYCRSGFGAPGVEPHQRRFFNRPERYLDLLGRCREAVSGAPLHRVGIAPHSLRAVSPDDLDAVFNDAPSDGQIHIHVAEQPAEVAACREQLGTAPVAWLTDRYELDDRWCLVHATHMEAAEAEAAAATGAAAGLCPTTEADLGDGFFDTQAWLAADGEFGIGSDSNLRISVTEELRLLEFQARLRGLRRNVLADAGLGCGRSLHQRATRGGARALGQPVGEIRPGARADLVELDGEHPLLAGRDGDTVLDTWIFADPRDMIRTVWVAGIPCVQAGRHLRRDVLEPPFRRAMRALA
ncbi:formimidoylglutamate deiminase [Elongatibacter sediminis]|uniref:Formimidoylglutamate deiminase n=1 Tax=Elongatibacter sediminis TaxID=3119006 RepID=A0AAW9R932_9GAMM